MKRIILVLALLIPITACYARIENGDYELSFRISDMGFQQIITVTNCTYNPDISYYKFDVLIAENGALKRFADDAQTVNGLVYDGKFKFIIPYANVVTVDAYCFEGANEETNEQFCGKGDVPFQGPNSGNNKFTFWMKKKDPEQGGPGYPPQGVGSPDP